MTRAQIMAVLHAALRAPSADNHHHLRFLLHDDRILIQATQHALDPSQPHRRALTLISMGALIENATLRARTFGILGRTRWFPDAARPDIVCELSWTPGMEVTVDPLVEAIDSRHSNRTFFRGPARAADDLNRLQRAADDVEGARLLWLEDSDGRRKRALRLILLAEAERFRSEVLHEELFASVRFDVGWNASCEEGLPPGALGVEPFMRAPFAALRHWPLMRALNVVGGHWMLGMRAAYLPCRLAPHLAVVCSDLSSLDGAAVAAGRALERFWLQATLLGLAVQPLAAATVLPLQTDAQQGARDGTRQALREGWESICGGSSKPMVVLRVGHAAAPKVRTSRRPVEHYLAGDG